MMSQMTRSGLCFSASSTPSFPLGAVSTSYLESERISAVFSRISLLSSIRRILLLIIIGYLNSESGTFFQLALKIYCTAKQLDVTRHNVQTKSRSLHVGGILRPEKTFEQMRLVVLRYPDPPVLHIYRDRFIRNSDVDLDDLVLRGKLYGIGSKIEKDVF